MAVSVRLCDVSFLGWSDGAMNDKQDSDIIHPKVKRGHERKILQSVFEVRYSYSDRSVCRRGGEQSQCWIFDQNF